MARHILSILAVIHAAGRSHGALQPDAVEVDNESASVQLRVFPTDLLARQVEYQAPEEHGLLPQTPEAELPSTDAAGSENFSPYAADMFSFGVLVHFMNLPQVELPVAGCLSLPTSLDPNLRSLLQQLLASDPDQRPTASEAMLHPYFTASYSDRLIASGDLLRQNEKLEAVRSLIRQVRRDHSNRVERLTVQRRGLDLDTPRPDRPRRNSRQQADARLVWQVLEHFARRGGNAEQAGGARSHLKVEFQGEVGLDEGGLTAEMFRLFFEGLVSPEVGLFECSASVAQGTEDHQPEAGEMAPPSRQSEGAFVPGSMVYLPKVGVVGQEEHYRAVGRAVVKCFYEGKRIGSHFANCLYKFLAHGQEVKHAKGIEPRALDDLKQWDPEMGSSLDWLLRNTGAEHLGLDFEDIPGHSSQTVSDANKAEFVHMKARYVLVECRLAQLEAIRSGFWQAMMDLSPEATPFLRLLSSADWSVLLCGEDNLTPEAVTDCLEFRGFPKSSKIPKWLPQTILQFSPDNLRRFLIFCTGSPSLPPAASDTRIGVQYNRPSNSLPVAHTCFFKLDLPDYPDQSIFVEKLMKAIQECATFDRA